MFGGANGLSEVESGEVRQGYQELWKMATDIVAFWGQAGGEVENVYGNVSWGLNEIEQGNRHL